MATNQITIVLEDCEPIGGYYVFYRPVGSADPYRFAGIFFTSPIIFTDENDPANQEYEGYIQSHCGGGIFGDPIPWETEGSPSVPGGSEPEPDECCDPVVLTADTETTIPDGSLPGSGSEPEVCCTPVILNACIETLDESGSGSISGSESGSGSEEPPFGIMHEFTPATYPTYEAQNLAFWNTLYNTALDADTPFDEIVLFPDEFKILLKGCTNLSMASVWFISEDIVGFWDYSGSVIEATDTFVQAINLVVAEINSCITIGVGTFESCTSLISVSATSATTLGAATCQNSTALQTANFPAAVTIGNGCFNGCAGIETIFLNSCSTMGATTGDENVFGGIVGQTITLTLLTGTETDADVIELQANNTVTLILV